MIFSLTNSGLFTIKLLNENVSKNAIFTNSQLWSNAKKIKIKKWQNAKQQNAIETKYITIRYNMAIHKSKSTNLSNQEIHILLYLIIFTFRLLQAYITSILGLFLFSYLCTLPLYVLSELYFANFILYVFILLFFVTCVINYFLVTYKS